MPVEWITAHKFLLGVLADSLTFVGAAILARDALRRLSNLRRARTDAEFRKVYNRLHLSDEELAASTVAVRWALSGFVLMATGFLCQFALRFAE